MKAIEKNHKNIRREIKECDLFSNSKVEELLNEKYIDDLTEILTYWLGELRMIAYPPSETDDIEILIFIEDMDIASTFSLRGALEHFDDAARIFRNSDYGKEEKERIKTALLNIAESIET